MGAARPPAALLLVGAGQQELRPAEAAALWLLAAHLAQPRRAEEAWGTGARVGLAQMAVELPRAQVENLLLKARPAAERQEPAQEHWLQSLARLLKSLAPLALERIEEQQVGRLPAVLAR
jgi:hypothetical protein